jgi:hypothetical protein
MSFNPIEIATMLRSYENDYHTGMDIAAIARDIHSFTDGYPFLVSRICKYIDEELARDWSPKGVSDAVKLVLSEKNTLFDDVVKSLESNDELSKYIYELLILGDSKKYSINNPTLDWGLMFGFLKRTP